MGTKARKTSWNAVLFSVTGTLRFEVKDASPSENDDPKWVCTDLHNALIEADKKHPWIVNHNNFNIHWGAAPSLGKLDVHVTETKENPGHSVYCVDVGPILPLKPAQLCAYHRYLETLAATALRSGYRRFTGVQVSMTTSSCYGEWINK